MECVRHQINVHAVMDGRLTKLAQNVRQNVIAGVSMVKLKLFTFISMFVCVTTIYFLRENIFATGHCGRPNECDCNSGYKSDSNDPFRQVF